MWVSGRTSLRFTANTFMHCLCARWLDDGEPVLLCTKPTAKSKYSLYRSVLCWQVKNEHDDQFSEELFPFCGGVTEVG